MACVARAAGALPLRLADLLSASAGLQASINITAVATQVRVASEERVRTSRSGSRLSRASSLPSLRTPRTAAPTSSQPFAHARDERDTSLFSSLVARRCSRAQRARVQEPGRPTRSQPGRSSNQRNGCGGGPSVVVRTVPITRGTSRPASASSAATKKKKNPDPPLAPPATRGTGGSGVKGAAGATSGFAAGTWACTPPRPPGPLSGLWVRAGPLPRAIAGQRAASLLPVSPGKSARKISSLFVAGAELDGMPAGTALPGRADRVVPGAATGAVEPGAVAVDARIARGAAGVVRATGAGCRPPLVGGRDGIVAAAPWRCVLG